MKHVSPHNCFKIVQLKHYIQLLKATVSNTTKFNNFFHRTQRLKYVNYYRISLRCNKDKVS